MVSTAPVELWTGFSSDDAQAVIRAVYRQVLGNAHVMESEQLTRAESQLQDGTYSVQEFVRTVAKSDFYRARFFESCAPYRFVEMNFKHLLGRAPKDQAELSEHIQRVVNEGYDAEIDSYIDSEEYQALFGDNTVPYYRDISQVGFKQVSYNRVFSVVRGPAESDKAVTASQLVDSLATNAAVAIKAPATGRIAGYKDATEKTFKIVVRGAKFDSQRRRRSTTEYIVSGAKMTPKIQQINRMSGTIVSITEVA
ncbi:MAG: photosystem I reaction center subunit XII [Spirulina sp. SIO3F2]|nr:photosystem I reaction center subunit XII [Spirulina sp. SIO3F2]